MTERLKEIGIEGVLGILTSIVCSCAVVLLGTAMGIFFMSKMNYEVLMLQRSLIVTAYTIALQVILGSSIALYMVKKKR